MSENEKDYSDYISYASNFLLMLSLYAGFSFTALTILVTQLPEPSQIIVQITLFFLTTLFGLFAFLAFYFVGCILHCVEDVPPKTKLLGNLEAISFLTAVCFPVWGMTVPLMFLIWNLIILALASFLVLLFFDIWGIFVIVKPNLEHLRRMRSKK